VKLAAVVGVVLCIGANVLVTALRSRTYPSYWLDRMNELAPPDAVQLVAFGDSSVQAIGAEQPTDGYVGRIADYIQARTHRPVHISNVSDGGTTRDIIDRQLPKVDVRSAHLVVIGSANDM
jgi:lysophospholipase L1-like esterase